MTKQEITIRYYAGTKVVGLRCVDIFDESEIFEWFKKGLSNVESLHPDTLNLRFSRGVNVGKTQSYNIEPTADGFNLTPTTGGEVLFIERFFDEDAFLRSVQRKAIVNDAVSGFKSLFSRK